MCRLNAVFGKCDEFSGRPKYSSGLSAADKVVICYTLQQVTPPTWRTGGVVYFMRIMRVSIIEAVGGGN
jgi:hypothetical protein